ncbi:hypothetical protein SDC9_07422 [bioreactor metagenome]|uniref:Uncharacterized protein n=1 Tax=bioreactor metagenome TaxID=1076179 RepID=A0A644T4I3_9ZZZZ|nr:hypothetical protein [Methanobrevibacter sp.]MEA4956878.1 hypothetical protein [Methanobrevibacter sp.]
MTEDTTIAQKILRHLDGWVLKDSEDDLTINDEELSEEEINRLFDGGNKKVYLSEVMEFYEEAELEAELITGQLPTELNEIGIKLFYNGIYLLTASNLWNKYNVRVNEKNTEGEYIPSYGGLLYSRALKKLKPLTKNTIIGLSGTS